MKRWTPLNWLALGVVGAAASSAGYSAQAQSPPGQEVVERQDNVFLDLVQVVAEQAADPSALAQRIVLLADTAVPNEYWLGISLSELPDVAKQQLGIESGLVVADVMEDSPAAKAEFKKHDILIKADDTALKAPHDLLKVVDASKGKQIEIVVVRGGKDRTITVAPVKRAEEHARREKGKFEVLAPQAELANEIKGLELALQNLKSKAGDGALSLWFPKPAVVAPRVEYKLSTSAKESKAVFPKNLSVQINKQGGQPTQVHVKQGDKEWNITEDKSGISLSELPEEIRPHVLQVLRGFPASGPVATRTLRVMQDGKVEGEIKIAPVPPVPPNPPKAPTAGASSATPAPPQIARLNAYRVESGGVEGKLDAIMKKLDQLSQEVDELRGKSSGDKK